MSVSFLTSQPLERWLSCKSTAKSASMCPEWNVWHVPCRGSMVKLSDMLYLCCFSFGKTFPLIAMGTGEFAAEFLYSQLPILRKVTTGTILTILFMPYATWKKCGAIVILYTLLFPLLNDELSNWMELNASVHGFRIGLRVPSYWKEIIFWGNLREVHTFFWLEYEKGQHSIIQDRIVIASPNDASYRNAAKLGLFEPHSPSVKEIQPLPPLMKRSFQVTTSFYTEMLLIEIILRHLCILLSGNPRCSHFARLIVRSRRSALGRCLTTSSRHFYLD